MNLTAVAIGSLVISLACVGLSIPAILRKIPMNKMYGVRFRQCFKSDEAWYEINAYGGKALLAAASDRRALKVDAALSAKEK